jgi:hypothetical protein
MELGYDISSNGARDGFTEGNLSPNAAPQAKGHLGNYEVEK